MKRYKISKDWILVWSVTFLICGLTIAFGYKGSSTDITPEKPGEVANKAIQASAEKTSQNVSSIPISAAKKQTAKSMELDQELQEEIKIVFGQKKSVKENMTLEDFPSPVKGKPIRNIGNYYSEEYGNYSYHAGLDYALREGTVIRATHGGKVIIADPDPILGHKVTIDCGEGWLVTYGGLDNLRVQKGEVIETLGAVGQIGLFPGSEGNGQPQLHYEVWHNGQLQKLEI